MINRVVLTGRPIRDLELKSIKSGNSVCSFPLAVNRSFKSKSGEREADFINCVAWGKTAEVMSQYIKKGSLIGVDGRIQTRSYDNRDGQRVYVTEVVVKNFSFLSGSGKGHQVSKNNHPFNNQPFNQSNDPFDPNGQVDISDDDLPF